VVELTIRAELYRNEPDRPEGELSKLRRSVVNTYALARAAERIGLGEALLLGRGEDLSGGRRKPSLLCNTLEAVVGATFLDGGWEPASELVLRLVGAELTAALAAGPDSDDPKTQLQELAVRLGGEPPAYVVADEGPEHEKWFTATVTIDPARAAGAFRGTGDDRRPIVVGHGGGQSKKMAEQSAARDALRTLDPANAVSNSPEKIGTRDA
jgi:ribonuclease-3